MKGIISHIGILSLGVLFILGSGGPSPGISGVADDTDGDTDADTGNDTNTDTDNSDTDTGSNTLSTPTNVVAQAAYKGAVLTWKSVSTADTYELCYATERIDNYDDCTTYSDGTLATVNTSSAMTRPLTVDQSYYFRVIAQKGENTKSTASANVWVTPNLGLNDTGLTGCGNGVANNLNCGLSAFPKQDAEYGLDALATGANDSVNGYAGFTLTKLDSDGNALGASVNEWACVKDNNTGLIWEAKVRSNGGEVAGNDGLHDADDRFEWYSTNANNNAGKSGDENSSESSCHGYDAANPASYCNTQAYVARVNAEGYCGIKKWRMPTRFELNSIVNYDTVTPAIDLAYFQYTSSALYWTDTPLPTVNDFAWAINFNYGGSAKQLKENSYRVRLVSSGQ